MASNNLSENMILGFGNPLLDISASVTPDFLKKYDMEPNNAILASDKQANLSKDLVDNFKVDYIAGGAVQNTMRVIQWFFSKKHVATFMGAIGVDKFADQMRSKAEDDGVNVVYQVADDTPTGTCACLLSNNGKNRSLCAFLGASQKLTVDHVQNNWELVERAKIIYVSGFNILVCIESALLLSEHCVANPDKLFVFNLSAPYIMQVFGDLVKRVFPFVELLFGNETEALAFSEIMGWGTTDIAEIAQKLADYDHKAASRTVVITQGVLDVIVTVTGAKIPLRRFPIKELSDEEIVDTNGAGDAFVGGYLALLLQGHSVEECVEAGNFAATAIIKRNGCSVPKDDENKYRV